MFSDLSSHQNLCFMVARCCFVRFLSLLYRLKWLRTMHQLHVVLDLYPWSINHSFCFHSHSMPVFQFSHSIFAWFSALIVGYFQRFLRSHQDEPCLLRFHNLLGSACICCKFCLVPVFLTSDSPGSQLQFQLNTGIVSVIHHQSELILHSLSVCYHSVEAWTGSPPSFSLSLSRFFAPIHTSLNFSSMPIQFKLKLVLFFPLVYV